MDQRQYGVQKGYQNLDKNNNGQQLDLRNSDYKFLGPIAAVPRGPVVSPLQRPHQSVAAGGAVGQPRRSTPSAVVEGYPPQYLQEQLRMAYGRSARGQSARSVAAPVDSHSSFSGSQASSSRGSIIEKKKRNKESLAQRKPTPRRPARAPQSVAAPVDSRTSLSSAASVKLSSRQKKKILKHILGDVSRDESQSSTRKKKKAAKKGRKGSKKDKKNRQQEDSSKRRRRGSSKRSASKKSVRFEAKDNGPSRPGPPLDTLDFARRHADIINNENAKKGEKIYNGYINHTFNGGYFDLTSSQDEPAFLIKIPARVMLRALQTVDPENFARARGCAERQRQQDQIYHGSSPHAQPTPPQFEVYVDPEAADPEYIPQRYGRQADARQNVDMNRSRHGNY